jgi:site-specific DNA-methyltransferase (adenine-specific)
MFDGAYAGFQPKPAVEVIIVAMKPLSEKTFGDQAQANGKGITWLGDCRITCADEAIPAQENSKKNQRGSVSRSKQALSSQPNDPKRFPANLLVSDDVLGEHSKYFGIDKWAEEHFPFVWIPKASRKEKEAGLEVLAQRPIRRRDPGQDQRNVPFKARTNVRKNQHPTVKPLKLMSYLITMGSRPGDIVLDPFSGTGTTSIAAMLLKRDYVGIEISPEYHEIALKRLDHFRRKKAA